MSDNEEVFATTGNLDQAKLEEASRKGDSSRLALVQQNRQAGLRGLNRAVDGLEESVRRLPLDGLVLNHEDGSVFNLNQALREVLQGLQNALTSIEAAQSLEDMVIHDLAGVIKNLENVAAANWQTGAHHQVLIEVLKEKGLVEESDLRAKWDQLIPEAVKQMKANQPK